MPPACALTPQPAYIQALIDGPETGVPRQAIAYKKVVLTPYVLKKLPRAAGQTVVSKVWKASGVQEKWDQSAWAKKRAVQQKRRSLSDFDRFKVQLLKTERRKVVSKGECVGRRFGALGGR